MKPCTSEFRDGYATAAEDNESGGGARPMSFEAERVAKEYVEEAMHDAQVEHNAYTR